MSKVLSEISHDYNFIYFTCSHDNDISIGEQNHQNKKLSAGFDMDFKPNFLSSLVNVQSKGMGLGEERGCRTLDNVHSL